MANQPRRRLPRPSFSPRKWRNGCAPRLFRFMAASHMVDFPVERLYRDVRLTQIYATAPASISVWSSRGICSLGLSSYPKFIEIQSVQKRNVGRCDDGVGREELGFQAELNRTAAANASSVPHAQSASNIRHNLLNYRTHVKRYADNPSIGHLMSGESSRLALPTIVRATMRREIPAPSQKIARVKKYVIGN